MRGYSTYSMELLASLFNDYSSKPFSYSEIIKRDKIDRSFFFTMLGKGWFLRVTKQMPRYENGKRIHIPATYRLSDEVVRLIQSWKERQEKKNGVKQESLPDQLSQ
jgi:hypothetical protein